MERTTATHQAVFATHVSLEVVVILSAHYTEFASKMLASVTNFRDTKAPCVKFLAVPDGQTTVATMALATKPPKSARVIPDGLVPRVTFQTVPVPLTAMGVVLVTHQRMLMRRLSVIAPKDGWVLLANFRASLGVQLVITFACVTCVTTGPLVTCSAPIIVHCVWEENAIVVSRVGEDSTARGKVALATREIALGTVNVCLQKCVSAIQAGMVRLLVGRLSRVISFTPKRDPTNEISI